MTYSNGDIYIGSFKSNKKNGDGELYLKNGTKLQGKFINGEYENKI